MKTNTLPDPYTVDAMAIRDAARAIGGDRFVLSAHAYEPDPDIDGGHPSLRVILNCGGPWDHEAVDTIDAKLRPLGLSCYDSTIVNMGYQRDYAFETHPGHR